ncbi:MAG: UDPGP type 1 family protein [Verrucomicrobia bacterium]|nr:UDPGP type 1 family protein [Verrucomicrobiota bacterium]
MIHPRHLFEDRGQGHVFRYFDELPPAQQDELTRQALTVDLDEIDHLVEILVNNPADSGITSHNVEPAEYISISTREQNPQQWQQAKAAGEQAIRDGRVAAFTVAGGQGTRLGFDGPKGTFPVSPVSGKPLFQIFAEKLAATEKRHQCTIPWFIMTSEGNHDDTLSFFQEHAYFGLKKENIHLFPQGTIPAVDSNGKILLTDKHLIALSPDGHGGSLRALVRSGATQIMKDKGIDILSCFQVDNPLVKCIDPVFIGFHLNNESQLSSKMVEKRSPDEKVGMFCKKDGSTCVIEYSDLPVELQHETEANGDLRFRAGSIAIHLFNRELIEQLGQAASEGSLPFHAARKKVPFLDTEGRFVEPEEANAIKFEMFIFDALPFADRPLVLETLREVEFSPVKNAEGEDSPETSRRDQLRKFARWLAAAGVEMPVNSDGTPKMAVEISPGFADSKETFVAAWKALETPPTLKDGLVLEA